MRIVTITDAKTMSRGLVPNGVRVGRALARMGHDVSRIDHKGITREALSGAGLVLSFGTVVRAEAERPGYFRQINAAKDAEAIAALWYFDMCNPRQRHSPYKFHTVRNAAKHIDWLITTDHSYPWENVARNYLFLPQGVDPDEFDFSVLPPEPRPYDVIFTGGCDGAFTYRQRHIDSLKERFKVSLYGRGHSRRVYGRDFFAAHQRARTVLVPEPPAEARDHYWSNRIFLAAATGTPCVVGYVPGIDAYYEDEREVVYYRTRQEMTRAVAGLLADPSKRQVIGAAARQRTLTDHTYDARARALMGAIFKETTH